HHVGTGVEVGGVVGVDVEPVEGVVDVVRGALEVLRRADRVGVVELLEPDDGVHFVQEGGARGGVGDGLAVDGGAVGHRPVVGAVGDQPVGAAGGVVAQVGFPGVVPLDGAERHALAVELVEVRLLGGRAAVRFAQFDGVGVDDVLGGGGGAPGVVLA